MKNTIYLPAPDLRDSFFRHAGDTFRELVGLWQQLGFVQVKATDNNYVWLGEPETPNGVVLYDRPTLEWWKRSTPKQYKCALFGNLIPNAIVSRSFAWVFWARRPALLHSMVAGGSGERNYSQRPIESIFMGKIENEVQQQHRSAEKWRTAIEEFHLVVGLQTLYPFTQTQYLERLAQSRFGLCLRGYGPKCNREIELMALGTVPIVTPDVDMTGYFDPPQQGTHYLVAETPQQLRELIASVDEQEWQRMSHACRDWYLRNCSPKGSFYQTMRIIETVSTSSLVQKPIVSAWSVPPQKFPGTFRIAIDTVFFERPFSGISRVWLGLLRSLEKYRASSPFEIVLLIRATSLQHLPARFFQSFAFAGIPTFSYQASLEQEDVQMLNAVCARLDADLFISTYYTYTTVVPTLAFVHDMIPERFQMAKNAMWHQKDLCLANASAAVCVSNFTASELQRFCGKQFSQVFVVPNAFDASVFDGVDAKLRDVTQARKTLQSELGVELPFVLVCASNAESYKNLRLVTDMIRMNAPYFSANLSVVFVTTADVSFGAAKNIRVHTLRAVTDQQLGLLYGLASVMIYPSRCEGFGLPVLEAFWSECPVICSRDAGAVPEVAGDGCFYVNADDPTELFQVVKSIVGGGEVREKIAIGLQRVELFTPEKQIAKFVECLEKCLNLKKEQNVEPHKEMTTHLLNLPKENLPKENLPKEPPKETKETKENLPKEPLHIIVQYYNDGNTDRQNEYDFCVQANLANPAVAQIHCFLEPTTQVPDWLASNPKYVERRVPGRLTYKQAFDYANTNLIGKTCALMNLDIFLDHNNDWNGASPLFDLSIVFCLSRHEFDGVAASTKDPRLQNFAYANAQDAWVFRSPIFVKDCDFQLGKLGCDNAIAHRFKVSGYIPINSPNEFKIHHFDLCRGKRGDNFLEHHATNSERPEDRGYLLLPDYSALERIPQKTENGSDVQVISVDKLIEKMGLGQIHRYRIVCDMMSTYIKLGNPEKKE